MDSNFNLSGVEGGAGVPQLAVFRSFQKSPSGTRTFNENLNNLCIFWKLNNYIIMIIQKVNVFLIFNQEAGFFA